MHEPGVVYRSIAAPTATSLPGLPLSAPRWSVQKAGLKYIE
jgi:hypothetical protein